MGIKTALIVVAEDEALIRMVIVDAPTNEGFTVIEARHAGEAISHFELRGHDVRVLFTDVQMPGAMNGVGLAHHVRNRWPRTGVIVTSGLLAPNAQELPSGSRFVPKPYEAATVVAHVRELIAA